ncbi:MAG: aryldialkylphosphatase [Rhodospirillales bacterium]|nr:aryldialkylphosphatase [Rhodospirillales bacterium]
MTSRDPFIQTVCGPIDPATLGPTLMHEHVLCDLAPRALRQSDIAEEKISLENCWQIRHEWSGHRDNCLLDDEDVAAAELSCLYASGGRALVELTVTGIAPDPQGLRRISAASGIAIIAGCGFYTEESRDDDLLESSEDDLAKRMINDVRHGIGDSDVRAGIIGEIGCSDAWTRVEQKALHAAVVAQIETGASLNIHPPRSVEKLFEITQFIDQLGGKLERSIFSHIDRTIFTLDDLFRFADTGSVIEYDFFGIESSYYPFKNIDLPNDAMRLKMMRSLIDRGHLSQITLSQDICTKTRLSRYGGHGYAHIMKNVLPVMPRMGFSDAEIDALMVATPCRLLSMVYN